jgi:hypothetical protein
MAACKGFSKTRSASRCGVERGEAWSWAPPPQWEARTPARAPGSAHFHRRTPLLRPGSDVSIRLTQPEALTESTSSTCTLGCVPPAKPLQTVLCSALALASPGHRHEHGWEPEQFESMAADHRRVLAVVTFLNSS